MGRYKNTRNAILHVQTPQGLYCIHHKNAADLPDDAHEVLRLVKAGALERVDIPTVKDLPQIPEVAEDPKPEPETEDKPEPKPKTEPKTRNRRK